MHLIFGWHLDGHSFPETISGSQFDLGGLITGPNGLSQRLAIHLSVPSRIVPQAIRIAHYMHALHENNDGEQFYSQSFLLDPWSTSSCLLVQRDQLVGAGWNGREIKNESDKLTTLRRVEESAFPLASPAELLRALERRLDQGNFRDIGISSIKLATPIRLLPPIWQRILSKLCQFGVHMEEIELDPAHPREARTDLEKLQRYLKFRETNSFENDGTLCLLEADDEFQLAEVTSSWMAATDAQQLVILRDAPTTILDAYCNRAGLPRLGGHKNSPWRSILQVLPLMLETCWLPANPYRTLELITLPGGPVPRWLSHHFIKALRIEPGFGGARWLTAWQEVETDLFNSKENKSPTYVSEHLKNLRFWLEPNRYDPTKGIPAAHAIKIIQRIRAWASSCIFGGTESEMLTKTINSCQELEETLRIAGFEFINRIQLNRVIDAVFGEGCKPERWRAQVAQWTVIDHPGQIWLTVPTLLWWGFTSNQLFRPQPTYWASADRKALAEAGVELEHPSVPFTREAHTWKRALLSVTEELLLCRPRMSHGQPAPIHPIWHELEELLSQKSQKIIQKCHQIVSRPEWKGRRLIKLFKVEQSIPAAICRQWKAPPLKLTARPSESATSIRQLLSCPMAYVLRYHAQLHGSVLLTLPDSEQLLGAIAHTLFQQLFETSKVAPERAVIAAAFDKLVADAGLPLLQRGRSTERESAKRLLIFALQDIAALISEAQLSVVATESHREELSNFGPQINGDIDLLLEDLDGYRIIVDYKWNKDLRYKTEELQRGQQIQLATYAWLEAQQTQKAVHAGYYMLRQRRFLHGTNPRYKFGQQFATVSLAELWQQIEKEYVAVTTALLQGTVCATGVPVDVESEVEHVSSLTLDPPCRICDYTKICGRANIENA